MALPRNRQQSTMAYRVKIDADFNKDVRRLLTAQIGRAIGHLSGALDEGGSAIHETRKSLKRCRSIIRLVRPGLTAKSFRRHDQAFRAVARLLSQDRDREVLAQTLTLLTAGEGTQADKSALSAALTALHSGKANGFTHSDTDENVRAAITLLQNIEQRLQNFAARDGSAKIVAAGFGKTYSEGRKTLKAAYRSGDDDAFHTFRKALQHHWRHCQLLGPVWPELMDARITAARELSQLAGLDHDLSVLKLHISDDRHPIDEATRSRVQALAKAEQDRLRREVKPLAGRLYAISPRDIERMIERLWPAAKRLSKSRKMAALTTTMRTGETVPLKSRRLA